MHKGLVAVSFVGLLISGYLLVEYSSATPVGCISGEGCAIAQYSKYASFAGIPTPAYGIIFYLILGVIAALWSDATKPRLTLPLLVITSTGLGVSIFLSSMEAFVLHAWCSWCVGSAILTVIAFVLALQVSSNYANK